jgi:asparagine synthase (glutamine-hydrolysing)
MCGIAGRWLHEPAKTPMDGVLELLAHRGPDDRGAWRSPTSTLELGHTRLSIVDLSAAGHQPMLSPDAGVVLIYNGELYDQRELRADLEARGYPFRGRSDTEVVLAAYVHFKERMLPMLNGMFAIAIFDRERDELLLARDASGIKPLYYAEAAAGFSFASELKALLRLGPLPAQLDIQALYRYLSFLWCPGSATPLVGVSRLEPGELLRIRAGRVIARGRWAAPPFDNPVRATAEGAELEVESVLRAAVRRQLVADVPVGAFLSGGLDSSAVVAFASEQRPRLDCFTIAPEGGPEAGDTGDLPFARLVAAHLGVPLHEVAVSSARMAADLERMVYQLDEPVADPAALNVLYISQLARRHGIKVLLSGVGGDDLFAGYRRHRALIAERFWSWLPVRSRAGLRSGSAALARAAATRAWPLGRERAFDPRARGFVSLGSVSAIARRAAKAFAHADRGADQRLLGYFTWGDPETLRALFAPVHLPLLCDRVRDEPLTRYLEALPPGLEPLERMLALEQRFFLGDHNLPYADKMSMAAGVELRVPFLDPDVVALANRLPAWCKQHGREGKWILKRAMRAHLPPAVLERAKAGFGAPLRRWLRGELADWVRDVLSPERLRARGVFEPRAVLSLLDRDRRGEIDAAYPILQLCCTELWCRHFVDTKGH